MAKPLSVAPPQPEPPKRQPRPAPDRALLQHIFRLMRALNSETTFRERANLRADAHRAVDVFFDKKLATR